MSQFGQIFNSLCLPALTRWLADAITYFPHGVAAGGGLALTGVFVDFADESGTVNLGGGMTSGDGTVNDDPYGDRIRRQGMVEIPIGQKISERGGAEFQYTNPNGVVETWQIVRIVSTDENYQSVRITVPSDSPSLTGTRSRLQKSGGR